MSELTPLRQAVADFAARSFSPDFAELERRATRRRRRRIALAAAAATAAVVVGSVGVVAGLDDDGRAAPVELPDPAPRPATNGWVAVDGPDGGISLVRPGEDARRLGPVGSGAADDACPAWSPSGTRLLFGRLSGSSSTPASRDAELVVVPVDQAAASGVPTVIALDGFKVLPGSDPYPCAVWAPDGRFAALAGTGEVWIVDTVTQAVRRLPDQRPVDLEWRPGTDELALAGDLGRTRASESRSTPITVYSVSSGEFRQIGSRSAETVTWSPDGSTLAFRTGEDGGPGSLGLVDADGTDERTLVVDAGAAIHGIGPVWSPTGERIVFQRQRGCCEDHEVVLVNVATAAETVVDTPPGWRPFHVTWSPDGTTLLYTAWNNAFDGGRAARIVVPADEPREVTVLTEFGNATEYASHRWAFLQAWGRDPG